MDRRYITGTIFLTIAVVIAVVFSEAKYGDIQMAKTSLAAKKAEFDGQHLLIQEVDNINKEFSKVLGEINKVNDIIPKFTSVADLLVQMDYLTSRNGLVIKSIAFDGPHPRVADSSKYSGVRVDVSLLGSYDSFLNFSNDIKNNRHLMDITGFSITKMTVGGEGGKVVQGKSAPEPIFDFDVKIDVYYQ